MESLRSTRRVLVVGPEGCATGALASLLSYYDMDVVLVTSPYEAMQVASGAQFEVALVDLDADRACTQLTHMLHLVSGPRPKIIGLASDPDRAELDPTGCDRVLPRRPPLGSLLSALRPLIAPRAAPLRPTGQRETAEA